MIRQTGGSAFGLISTRSTPASSAFSSASRALIMPNCSPSKPVKRTSGTRISSLIRFGRVDGILFPPLILHSSNWIKRFATFSKASVPVMFSITFHQNAIFFLGFNSNNARFYKAIRPRILLLIVRLLKQIFKFFAVSHVNERISS